jgi:hypothetical protein
VCEKCTRIEAELKQVSERLNVAQRELARYRGGNDQSVFTQLWNECENALKELWRLREEMDTHAATHGSDS